MSKQEKRDDKDTYAGNGYKPGPILVKDPGGKGQGTWSPPAKLRLAASGGSQQKSF